MIKNEPKHSMLRRALWHDYRDPGLYMITLVVTGRKPLLGKLIEDNGQACIEHSELGKAIINEELNKISHFYPMVKVWKICVMPDHIHLILYVKAEMPPGKHLGNVVYGFKTGCTRALWKIMAEGEPSPTPGDPFVEGNSSTTQPSGPVAEGSPSAMKPLLFESGYNDKVLKGKDQLKHWKRYLDDNPRRLMLKRKHPDLFTVMHNVTINGQQCQAVGNLFLLDNPCKAAIIVHRRYSDATFLQLKHEWLTAGEAGGVLVSAAIAPREKEVLREAMDRGYSIILLRENGFPQLYKPTGEKFDACSRGQLLELSPWQYHTEQQKISRSQCLELNKIAQLIAQE